MITDRNGANDTKRQKTWVKDLRYGQTVSLTFFRQHAWSILLIIVSVVALMGLRYKTKTKMEQINRLQAECERSESAKLQEKAAYMTLIRETEMKRLVNENGLDLTFQEQPPYELRYED